MEQKEKSAADEGRIISEKERAGRKKFGLIGLGLTSLYLLLWPGSHTAYAGVAFFVG